VAVLLPQVPETAVAHLAAFKLGAVSVPLFQLFGEQALEFRLRDCGAAALVTDATGLSKLAGIHAGLPGPARGVHGGRADDGALDLQALAERASDAFAPVDTSADDPAVIIYTSGTTGSPKGALHAHRVLLGHLPGVEMPQELFPQARRPVLDAGRLGLDRRPVRRAAAEPAPRRARAGAPHGEVRPEFALRLMAEHGVRNAFLPPTALKMLRAVPDPARFGQKLRSVGSGGETLGEELLDWGRAAFGCAINEFYGQTECNLVVSNCASILPVRPGSMGRAVPGHEVAVVDAEGARCRPANRARWPVRRPDPVMFLGYWNNPEATAAKFAGDWLLTGDQGVQDEDGYFRFVGREDDVITSAGYRIGPGEIEDCLLRHPAVSMAAVVGVPDALRTERVAAVVVPAAGVAPDDALAREIQDFVRTRLAAHSYPREVHFAESLPMTATGKVMRREIRNDLGRAAAARNSEPDPHPAPGRN
jgi:acetyl-CoA synthetase